MVTAAATALAALVALAGSNSNSGMDAIASTVARRPVTIQCVKSFPDQFQAGAASWNADHTGPGDSAQIVADYCRSIRELLRAGHFGHYDGSDEAAALLVLVHEATHLQGGPDWLDETSVTCRSLHTTVWLVHRLELANFHRQWLIDALWAYGPEYKRRPCPGFLEK